MLNESNIVQFLLWVAIVQGIVLGAILLLSKRHRNLPNTYLALFLFSYALKLLLNTEVMPFLGIGLYVIAVAVLAVLFYLYILVLTKARRTFAVHHLAHLISPVLLVVMIFTFSRQWPGLNYGDIMKDDSALLAFSVIQFFLVLQVVFYMACSVHRLARYHSWIRENFYNLNQINLRWLTTLSICFLVIVLIWVIFGYGDIAILIKVLGEPPIFVAYLFWSLMSLVVLLIGYAGIARPEILLQEGFATNLEQARSKLAASEIAGYAKKLESIMLHSKPYLDPTLRLTQLAERMEVNTSILSAVINQHYQRNFNDYVNAYRVHEVQLRMKDPEYEQLTLLGLALESGFNSKSTFNAVFKKTTGLTPYAYKQRLRDSKNL